MATLALFARSTESRKALYWFFFSFDAPRKNEKIENEIIRAAIKMYSIVSPTEKGDL